MGFRLRKSISLGKGARINLSKRGMGLSVGKRGASVSMGKGGVYGNVGIPGTGMSYRGKIAGGTRSRAKTPAQQTGASEASATGSVVFIICMLFFSMVLGIVLAWWVGVVLFFGSFFWIIGRTINRASVAEAEKPSLTELERIIEEEEEVDPVGIKEAMRLEKEGRIDQALVRYEAAVANRFEGNFPYDRLAINYRKQKRYDEEIRVLEQAINVFVPIAKAGRTDAGVKLARFMERLEKAKQLQVAKAHTNPE